MKFLCRFINTLNFRAFLVINFGTLTMSLLQVHCQGQGGSAAIGVANPELIKEAIRDRYGDGRVDKVEYGRILPVVIRYIEDREGDSGYSFKTSMEFWTEQTGKVCYQASVAKMNSSGVPLRIYSVMVNCEGQILGYKLVL